MVLTLIWLAGLFSCLVGVELYIGRLQNGIAMLIPEDRVPIFRPIAILYGSYLAGILAFWYKPPFTHAESPTLQRIRFALAFFFTVALNIVMIYFVWRNHFGSTTTVESNVASAIKICGLLSFLVGPANAYYFGTTTKN